MDNQPGAYSVGQIIGINREAVAAHARTRPELLETKRLRTCRGNHIPEIDFYVGRTWILAALVPLLVAVAYGARITAAGPSSPRPVNGGAQGHRNFQEVVASGAR